jgi:hypothetical protein
MEHFTVTDEGQALAEQLLRGNGYEPISLERPDYSWSEPLHFIVENRGVRSKAYLQPDGSLVIPGLFGFNETLKSPSHWIKIEGDAKMVIYASSVMAGHSEFSEIKVSDDE